MESLRRRLFIILVICGALLTNTAAVDAQGRSEAALSTLDRTPHVQNQVLVQFRLER